MEFGLPPNSRTANERETLLQVPDLAEVSFLLLKDSSKDKDNLERRKDLEKEGSEIRRTLTSKQRRAIPLLARGMEQVDVAKTVGVTDRTIRNWLNNYYFQEALDKAYYQFLSKEIVTTTEIRFDVYKALFNLFQDPDTDPIEKRHLGKLLLEESARMQALRPRLDSFTQPPPLTQEEKRAIAYQKGVEEGISGEAKSMGYAVGMISDPFGNSKPQR